MSKPLKKGYTTGVHASFAFFSALSTFVATRSTTTAKSNKMENDDLDVTKGAEIVVTLSENFEELQCNPLPHQPYTIGSLKLYAGVGVGVVTKEGLKPPKGYPAINPTPLEALKTIHAKVSREWKDPIYGTIGITHGEQIAKETANAKVGVMGGLSILGTTGWVKPISADAYLDSIRAELHVAKANGYDHAILTLGNRSLEYAKEQYEAIQIVEIGNFVYDALTIVQDLGFKNASFICGIGKATKVMQGHQNTHNRFGQIDFEALKALIQEELKVTVDIEATKTVKGLTKQLEKIGKLEPFYSMIAKKSDQQLSSWFKTIHIQTMILK